MATTNPWCTQIRYGEFEFLACRAGLILSDEQMAEMHQAYSVIEAMAARVRRPRSPEADPALTFSVDQISRSMTSEILTIAEASDLIAARKLSPVELTRACLDRIARHDGRTQ